MNYQYIEQLLERYWECQTTIEEEQILRSFFSQPDIPMHLMQYADLFAYEANEKKESLGEEFDQRILAMIEEKKVVKAKEVKLSTRFAPFFKAAAVVAIALTIGNVAERTLQNNLANDAAGSTTVADTYARRGEITAKIRVIDQNKSEAIAKADSVNNQAAGTNQSLVNEEIVKTPAE